MTVFRPKIDQFSKFFKILLEIDKTHRNTYLAQKSAYLEHFLPFYNLFWGQFSYIKYKRKVPFLGIPSRTKAAAESCHGIIFRFRKKIPKAR